MAIQEVTMYRVICDRCGCGADEDSDYYAWMDTSQALDDAECGEWLISDAGHWCSACLIHDEERDEYVPNPEPVSA